MNAHDIQKLTEFAREFYNYSENIIDMDHVEMALAYMWQNIIDYADHGLSSYTCFVKYTPQCLNWMRWSLEVAGFKVVIKDCDDNTYKMIVDWSC